MQSLKQISKITKFAQQLQQTSKRAFSISYSQQKLDIPLEQADPEMYNLVQQDVKNQNNTLNLTPSQSYTSLGLQQSIGSIMNAKYSEGYPGQRYYGGTEYIDDMEILCQKRVLEYFGLNESEWAVNVQALSSRIAIFSSVTGIIKPHERVVYLGDNEGEQGLQSFYNVFKQQPDQTLQEFLDTSVFFEPKVYVVQYSSQVSQFQLEQLRSKVNQTKAYLIVELLDQNQTTIDTAFQYADVVVCSTDQFFQGNNGSLIMESLKSGTNLKNNIDQSLFPGLQGGPHNHNISGISYTLKQIQGQGYQQYLQQLQLNIHALLGELKTDNSLQFVPSQTYEVAFSIQNQSKILSQLNDQGLYAQQQGDYIHLDGRYLTQRGYTEDDFKQLGELVLKCIKGESVQDKVQQLANKIKVEYQ